MSAVLAFDIETMPDVAGIRQLHGLPADLPDREVAELAFQMRRTKTGSDFLPPHLQKVAVISCVLRNDEGIRVFSLEGEERDVIQRFFDGIEKFVPQLVSWNGRGFDLPVLVHRGLIHAVGAAAFWDTGDDNKDFRFNNYINRFHARHVDLMDVLSIYAGRGAPLDEMAQLAGLPGKIGIGGAKVWETHLAGDSAKIRDYCEADTANTYLLFLRYQLLRGVFSKDVYQKELKTLRSYLQAQNKPHWREFLSLWNEA